MMLMNAIENCSMVLAMPCMLVTLFCILFGYNSNPIPTLISLSGSIVYATLLAFAGQSMSSIALRAHFALFLAFAIYTVVAYADYRRVKRIKEKNKAEFKRKFEVFKQECFDARKSA